jgi:hypothetical protein
MRPGFLTGVDFQATVQIRVAAHAVLHSVQAGRPGSKLKI